MSDKEKNQTAQENSEEKNKADMIEKDKKKHKTEPKKTEKEKFEDKINDLGNKLAETNDKYLRLYSEFDNYRKRTAKERIELSKNAAEDMIVNLLPVLDDFDRALKAIEPTEQTQALYDGVSLIYNKMQNILNQKGLKAMESIGNNFDSELHEAIAQMPAQDEAAKGKIFDEVVKGYYLYDKVIRHAKVVVAN
ncbi:MAG: nucleotide exchange factor GrpE [Bacteroidetes bacterium]|nr:nucleotide exchange factor GrpE [Bacteroidota bacterium]